MDSSESPRRRLDQFEVTTSEGRPPRSQRRPASPHSQAPLRRPKSSPKGADWRASSGPSLKFPPHKLREGPVSPEFLLRHLPGAKRTRTQGKEITAPQGAKFSSWPSPFSSARRQPSWRYLPTLSCSARAFPPRFPRLTAALSFPSSVKASSSSPGSEASHLDGVTDRVGAALLSLSMTPTAIALTQRSNDGTARGRLE
jgi:hypothetical protein